MFIQKLGKNLKELQKYRKKMARKDLQSNLEIHKLKSWPINTCCIHVVTYELIVAYSMLCVIIRYTNKMKYTHPGLFGGQCRDALVGLSKSFFDGKNQP